MFIAISSSTFVKSIVIELEDGAIPQYSIISCLLTSLIGL